MKNSSRNALRDAVIAVATAVIVAVLVGNAPPWWWRFVHPEKVGPIVVLDNRHVPNPDGMYFGFIARTLDAALGKDNWDNTILWITRQPAGAAEKVHVWHKPPNDGSGDALGRLEIGANGGDWAKGELLYVYK